MNVATIIRFVCNYINSNGQKFDHYRVNNADRQMLEKAIAENNAGNFGAIVAELISRSANKTMVRDNYARLAQAALLTLSYLKGEATTDQEGAGTDTNKPSANDRSCLTSDSDTGDSVLDEETTPGSAAFSSLNLAGQVGEFCDDGVSAEAAQALYRSNNPPAELDLIQLFGDSCDDNLDGDFSASDSGINFLGEGLASAEDPVASIIGNGDIVLGEVCTAEPGEFCDDGAPIDGLKNQREPAAPYVEFMDPPNLPWDNKGDSDSQVRELVFEQLDRDGAFPKDSGINLRNPNDDGISLEREHVEPSTEEVQEDDDVIEISNDVLEEPSFVFNQRYWLLLAMLVVAVFLVMEPFRAQKLQKLKTENERSALLIETLRSEFSGDKDLLYYRQRDALFTSRDQALVNMLNGIEYSKNKAKADSLLQELEQLRIEWSKNR